MISLIVVDGDGLRFDPMFGDREVKVIDPPMIKGSGQATIMNKKICIAGDEKKVSLKASYKTVAYPIEGFGTVTISKLNSNQEAPGCTDGGAAMITKGSMFEARFTPQIPASAPGTPPPTDQTSPSQGKGEFITQQSFSMAGIP